MKALFADCSRNEQSQASSSQLVRYHPARSRWSALAAIPLMKRTAHLRTWLEAMRTPGTARSSLNEVRIRVTTRVDQM